MDKTKEVPEKIQRLLKEVVDHYDKEDRAVRERQIRTWRRLKLFWDGFQRIWYSEVAHDWRIAGEQSQDETNQEAYDKPVNIFRAYLESIIAALSVVIPPIKCYPDDADNSLDLATARAGDKIAQLICRHNNVSYLWIHALFIYCTEGLVACYSYPKEDEKYGTYNENKYENEDETHELVKCPACGETIQDTIVEDEFQPDEESYEEICPNCQINVVPEKSQETFTVSKLVGVTTNPKSRQCMEVYGGLYVKIANYAKKQADTPYLIFSYESHYAMVRARYSHLRDKISQASSGVYDPYERWGRLSTQYREQYPINNVTIRNTWLRPEAYEVLEDEDDVKELRKLYPKGVKVVHANDDFAEACQEVLDDCWTLTHNPLSDYMHHDPVGLLLVSLQEITNDLVSLITQTIEHGIPQTFADPAVVNFEAYRNMEAAPGMLIPATPKSGKTVGDGFHEVKTATLSGEVLPFVQQVQTFAQLVSGALPSLFGGSMGETKTASEYSMSRAQALQRLNTTWKTLTFWWKEIFGKVIPAYIKEMKDDEKFVDRDQFGNFTNILIQKAELEGKIGNIELEANENLPMSWSQVRDVVKSLIESNNPQIQTVLNEPENLPLIREAIGLTDMFIPGDDDRIKQYDEIKQLLETEPITIPGEPQIDPMSGQMMPPQDQQLPSVEIDPDFDNHQIQFEICRKWIISEEGRAAKINNSQGYTNVLLHAKMHLEIIQQQQASLVASQGVPNASKPNELNKETPIQGEGDVVTE